VHADHRAGHQLERQEAPLLDPAGQLDVQRKIAAEAELVVVLGVAHQDDAAVAQHARLRHRVPHQRLAVAQAAQLGRDRQRPQQDGGPALVDQDRPVADRRHHAALLVDRDEAQLLDRLHPLAQAIDGLVMTIGPERRFVHRLDRLGVARPLAH
jgi:hypothetical protein